MEVRLNLQTRQEFTDLSFFHGVQYHATCLGDLVARLMKHFTGETMFRKHHLENNCTDVRYVRRIHQLNEAFVHQEDRTGDWFDERRMGSIGDGHWPTELDEKNRHPKMVEILMKSYHVRYIPVLLLAITGLRGTWPFSIPYPQEMSMTWMVTNCIIYIHLLLEIWSLGSNQITLDWFCWDNLQQNHVFFLWHMGHLRGVQRSISSQSTSDNRFYSPKKKLLKLKLIQSIYFRYV
jgi:hypothetical protein